MQTTATVPFPRAPLYGAAAVLTIVIAAVGFARLSNFSASPAVDMGSVLETRAMTFADEKDGAVRIGDATTGETVAFAEPGTNGFLRGALRGISRTRKRDGVALTAPYALSRWSSGHITLTDSVTGATIDLQAFGPTNAAVFAAFLKSAKGAAP
jgi:putative photosynthetic complex assembly protein